MCLVHLIYALFGDFFPFCCFRGLVKYTSEFHTALWNTMRMQCKSIFDVIDFKYKFIYLTNRKQNYKNFCCSQYLANENYFNWFSTRTKCESTKRNKWSEKISIRRHVKWESERTDQRLDYFIEVNQMNWNFSSSLRCRFRAMVACLLDIGSVLNAHYLL